MYMDIFGFHAQSCKIAASETNIKTEEILQKKRHNFFLYTSPENGFQAENMIRLQMTMFWVVQNLNFFWGVCLDKYIFLPFCRKTLFTRKSREIPYAPHPPTSTTAKHVISSYDNSSILVSKAKKGVRCHHHRPWDCADFLLLFSDEQGHRSIKESRSLFMGIRTVLLLPNEAVFLNPFPLLSV